MRLIDADAFAAELKEEHDRVMCDPEVGKPTKWREAVVYNRTLTVLEKMPTVDAVPVAPGEWDAIEDDYTGLTALKCSECGQEYWFEDEIPYKIYNYCPNCGAKMDGGKDNG